MEKAMRKEKIANLFESRKGHVDALIKRDFISKGIATIPMRVTDYYDVISTYSVPRFETLNPEFAELLNLAASVMPTDCPLVLNIVEDVLTEEQRKIIKQTIQEYYAYSLGEVEKKVKRHLERFILMSVGLVISGVLLWLSQSMDEVPREMFFILFWFLGDTLCDYLLMTGHDLRDEKRTAGQLASIKVEFSKTFDNSEYTEKEVNELYSELEKDVKKTLRKEER